MEKVKAAICEDDAKVLSYLSRHLVDALKKRGIEMLLSPFSTGEDLLCALGNGETFQIYFMDIEMPGMNGIDLCQRFAFDDPQPLIIFISNKESLVFQSFEVRPFRFIRKSHFMEELDGMAADVKRELTRRRGSLVSIRDQNSTNVFSFDVNTLVYVEVLRKYCTVHTITEDVMIKCRLSDFEEALEGHGFLRPHRSYLVNYRFIFRIGKEEITLDNQTKLPLSRRKIQELKSRYLALLGKE